MSSTIGANDLTGRAMTDHTGEPARIGRTVDAGELAPEADDKPLQACREARHAHRRFRLLIRLFAALFFLALVGGWPPLDGTAASDGSLRALLAVELEAKPPPGRWIDLSSLDSERRETMNRTGTVSVAVTLLVVTVVLGGSFLLLYNGLVDARERVNAGWAQVENVYQRRLDLVPLLIDGVKTYMEHERNTLAELTKARARAIEADTILDGQAPQTLDQLKAVEASQGAVKAALTRLFAVVESYPDLKASQNFLTLQDQIEGTENRIAVERRNYNELTRRYNAKIQKFPGNMVADVSGFRSKPYFAAESTALKGLKDPFGRGD
ncbi:MAG: LemA family protein [Chromatiaceae bacterium]